MNCPNCGSNLNENASFCGNCGTSINTAPVEVPVETPVVTPVEAVVPEQYRPLSPWAYFGYQLLFSIPIVGFIFLIIFSFKKSNLNLRNFARSYWCGLIIAAIAVAVIILLYVVLMVVAGVGMYGISSY